jgi:hypothetical protein
MQKLNMCVVASTARQNLAASFEHGRLFCAVSSAREMKATN